MAWLAVYHVSGTLMLQSRIPRSGRYALDVRVLDEGVYILQVRMDRKTSNQRFVIAR